MRQDRQGVRTPADLERKYKFGAIAKLLERVDALEKRVKDMESQLQGAQTAEETEEITEG